MSYGNFIFDPILPVYLMGIICGVMLILSIIRSSGIIVRILDILIVAILFVTNLRPMIPSDEAIKEKNNFDVIFVVDATLSMNAEDYNGNSTRISAVKRDCQYIIKELTSSRFSVITFDNYARVLTPFTIDTPLTYEAIESIRPISRRYANGTNLNTAYNLTLKMLKSSAKTEDRKRILFFISDGENTDGKALQSFAELRSYVANGAILGYGTANGGEMKTDTYSSNQQDYVKLANGQRAVSKMDESTLKKIAEETNLEYIHMEEETDIYEKVEDILEMLIVSEPEEYTTEHYTDVYPLLILPLMLLLAIKYLFTRKGE